jgi:large repetitive protein
MNNKTYALMALVAGLLTACPAPGGANRPPTIGISSPDELQVVGSSLQVTLNGPTDPDGDSIKTITYKVDAGTASALSATNQGQTIGLAALSEGEHTVEVTATDVNNNTTTPGFKRKFRVDATRPVVDPISVDGSVPTGSVQKIFGTNVSILVTGFDKFFATDTNDSGTSSMTLQLRLDGNVVRAVNGGSLVFNTKDLTAGSHTLIAQAVDAAGNTAVIRTQVINVVEASAQDTTVPEISFINPTTDGIAFAPNSPLTVVVNASDKESGILATTVRLGATPLTSTDGGISFNTTLPATEGIQTINAFTTNSAGLKSAVITRTIKIDGTAPVVSISVNPVVGDRIDRVISGLAVDELAGTASVTVSIQALNATDQPIGTPIVSTVSADATTGAFTNTWNPSGLSFGKYRISVTAKDKLGNVSVPSLATATLLDKTKPEISLLSPGASSTFAAQVPLSALVSDNADDVNAGVTALQFIVDGQTSPINGTVDPANPRRFTATALLTTSGTYKVRAQANDAAGNIGQSTETSFTINASAPSVTFTSPTTNFVNASASIIATATATSAIQSIAFSEGTNALGTDTTSPFTANFDATGKPDGVYLIKAVATDANGFVGQNTLSLTLDKTAPNVSFTEISPIVGNKFERQIITIKALGNDGLSGLTRIELYVGVNGATPALFASQSAATASFVYSADALNYSDTVILELRGVDAAGNTTSVGTSQRTFTVTDLIAPTNAQFTSPVFDTISADTNVTVTAQDNNAVTGVRFFVDGVLTATDLAAPFNFNLVVAGLSNGTHSILAEVFDAAGNVSSVSKTITIAKDIIAPGLTLTNKTIATNGFYKGGSILEFLFSAADPTPSSGFNNVTFTPSAGTVGAASSTAPVDVNTWTLPTTTGNVNLRAVATDASSNASNPVFLNVSVDADAPTLNFTNVVSNQVFSSSPIDLGYIASDILSGVKTIELREDGVLIATSTTPTASFKWVPSKGNGTYVLELVAVDNVGNRSAPVSVSGISVTIPQPDITPPTVSINLPLPDPASGSIAISVSANDSSGISAVTLLIDGTPSGTDSAAPYSFSVDTALYNNGQVSLQARATDTQGNTSSNTAPTVINVLNARVPEFSIVSPANQAILNGNNTVSVSLLKRSTDYTFVTPITVDVLDYRGTTVASRTIAASGAGPATFVQPTTDIDFNGFPIDAYVIRARVTVDVAPPGASVGDGELVTQINVSNNNTSNQPPALQILSPLRLNQEQTTVPAMIQRNGIIVADLSDNSGLASVELRVTCDFGCGTLGPVNALEQYQAFVGSPSQARVFLKYDADATPYLPEGKYTFRVVAQDVQGNRNIQEIKAEINRSGVDSPPAPAYTESVALGGKSVLDPTQGATSVALCPGSATYSLGNVPSNARIFYWVTDPTGKLLSTGTSVGNTSIQQAFTVKGNWTFNAIVQEFSGNFTVIGTGATVSVNQILSSDPCP